MKRPSGLISLQQTHYHSWKNPGELNSVVCNSNHYSQDGKIVAADTAPIAPTMVSAIFAPVPELIIEYPSEADGRAKEVVKKLKEMGLTVQADDIRFDVRSHEDPNEDPKDIHSPWNRRSNLKTIERIHLSIPAIVEGKPDNTAAFRKLLDSNLATEIIPGNGDALKMLKTTVDKHLGIGSGRRMPEAGLS